VGTGRERLLIDTAQGMPVWLDELKGVLAAENAVVTHALITHHHHDHVGGIADLRTLESPPKGIHKNSPEAGCEGIEDGQTWSVEGATVRAAFTPGHAFDHMCFVLEEEGALFTGDNVLGHGTTVFKDLKEYMESLQKMLELRPRRLYPAHGQIVEDGVGKIREYMVHRQRREAQIVGNLMKVGVGEKVSSMELVKRIYADVDEGLYLAAEGGVVQVLEKLEKEGKVGKVEGDSTKWFLKAGL
jgi:ribonuclease/clavin/mitogillin